MRVLITGIDGFTGFHLKAELERKGHTIIALQSDLTNYDALASEVKQVMPNAVVHLAGVTYVGHSDPRAFYDVNLIGTYNLLNALACHAPEVGSVLLVSSANVYGINAREGVGEDIMPSPVNDYSVSKLAMEQMALLWVGRLPLFIVRPFNYTGVGQSVQFLIPKIVSHFCSRESMIELGNLDVWREFGDVRTVVDIYGRLLDRCPAGEIINICTGKAYSLREVVLLCEKITGHYMDIKINPKFVRSNEVRVLTGNNDRLYRLIDHSVVYEFEDTLQWMLSECNNVASR